MPDKTKGLPSVEQIELLGGRLCLDFANTVNRVQGRCRDERFQTFGDVLRWSRRLGLIGQAGTDHLAAECVARPRKAVRALQNVVEFRERLWRVFSGADIKEAERLLQTRPCLSLPRLRVVENGQIVVDPDGDFAAWLLAAIYGSALELLTSIGVERVKTCPGHRCGWLFLHDSRTKGRKWCSMKSCGNRQKALEHYKRRRRLA